MRLLRREPETDWPLLRAWRDLPEFFHLPETFMVDEDTIRVDEYREDGTLVIRAEMPGIDPDKDVTLEVSEGRLMIRAERKREEKEEGRNYYRRELSYGAFARSLPLPADTKDSDVKATYHDGILEIRVPVGKLEKEATRIPITKAES